MLKGLLAAVGLGLAGYVAYSVYTENRGVSANGEGGLMDITAGVIEGGFMKVTSFNGGLNMGVSLAGLAHIKGWEGFRVNRYLDSAGKPTIGYGHLILPTESYQTITIEEATRLLVKDLSAAEDAVNSLVKIKLTQFQFDALVSFVFNVGRGAFARSTLLKKVNAGLFTEAKAEFLKWVNSGGKFTQGLYNRRVADAELFAAGGNLA